MRNTLEQDYKIPALDIIVQAFSVPWVMRKKFIWKLLFPAFLVLVLIVAGSFLQKYLRIPLFVDYCLFMLACTFFIVTCHRIVLLGDESVPPFGLRKWSMRETRFFGWSAGILVVIYFPISALFMLIGLLVSSAGNTEFFIQLFSRIRDPEGQVIVGLLTLPLYYPLARLSMLFPAVALDKRPGISWAWDISKGNGWRLTLIVGALPLAADIITNIPTRENSTVIEYLGVTFLWLVLLTVEIAALSLAYKDLCKGKPGMALGSPAAGAGPR